MYVGTKAKRVDAFDKVTGRAKFTEDLCPRDALVAKVLHSTIAHGYVRAIDTSEAEKIPGVVKIFTCFDVPENYFPTDGHIYHLGEHREEDRLLLNRHVRLYGDDIAAVVAEDKVAADRALKAIKVEYDELPFYLDPQEAMKEGAAQIQEKKPGNICGESHFTIGDYDAVTAEEGLLVFDNWYNVPTVQHCHIENHECYAYEEAGKIVVVSSTQIPHIIRRCVGQALGRPWGSVRIVKPYIGGGFGNKQDALYEPLCAWLSLQLGGRCVHLQCTREETFYANRVRHSFKMHMITHVRPNGKIAARRLEFWSRQGGYTSHGHGVSENAVDAFNHIYQYEACKDDAWTVYTNTPSGGAMRAYGFPQMLFGVESQMEDIAAKLGMDSMELRRMNMMPVGFVNGFNLAENFYDSLNQCLDKGEELFHYKEKLEKYKNQTGPVRRGVGMAIFYYTAGVWPVSVEHSSCRMVMNQDGSIQIQLGETEIGQGADTVFAQMAADSVGLPLEKVHVVSQQDTDVTPIGLGVFASRGTYVASYSIRQTGELLKQKILEHAQVMTRQPVFNLKLEDGVVYRIGDNKPLCTTEEIAKHALYNLEHSSHLTAETSADVKNNAFNFGCSFVEVEVDIPLCKVKVLDMLNVHDCGTVINPALAEGQVHGGMSMALGYAMSEKQDFDPATGRPLYNGFSIYGLPTAADHPGLQAAFVENYEPTGPFGNRALGEPPAASGAPAIRNAIFHATGAQLSELPMTPTALYQQFKEKGLL